MAGYIIGLVLGIIVFVMQNLKPTSIGFRVSFFVLTFTFMWAISRAQLGFWNILIIPLGTTVLCFISAFMFPYGRSSAKKEYEALNGRDYYAELRGDQTIGRIDVPGFKQTYDRIMGGFVWDIVHSEHEYQTLMGLLYSKNFFPISEHTKDDVLSHIIQAISKVSPSALKEGVIKSIFNTYVSIMSIHEEATLERERIEKGRGGM